MGLQNKSLIITLALLVLLACTYKVEKIGKICAHTGSMVHYERYFSIHTTEKRYTASWVEEALIEGKVKVPGPDWVRIQGTTSSLFGGYRAHSLAPESLSFKILTLDEVQEILGKEETLEVAKTLAYGTPAEQKKAIEYIFDNR